jgi:hypothetical protein
MTEETRRWFIQAVANLEVAHADARGAKLTFKAWTPMETDFGRATLNVRGLRASHDEILVLIKAYNPWVADGIFATRGEFLPGRLPEDLLMELRLTDGAAAVLGTRPQRWRLNLGLETRCVVYQDSAALARRLAETDHTLAEQFRLTGIQERSEPHQPMEEGDSAGTASVEQAGSTPAP